jgi:hypothetical protein
VIKTTKKELALLQALLQARDRMPVNERLGGHSPRSLVQMQLVKPDSPVSGLHRTGASLVSKGLAVRVKIGSKGNVGYRLTQHGLAIVQPEPVAPIETWWAPSGAQLAKSIQGVCGLNKDSASRIAAEAVDALDIEHKDAYEFGTRTEVTGPLATIRTGRILRGRADWAVTARYGPSLSGKITYQLALLSRS